MENKDSTSFTDEEGTLLTKQKGTVIGGAYVLPLEAPASVSDYTLQVVTLNATNEIVKTYNVRSFTDKLGNTLTNPQTSFALYANYLYSLGRKDYITDLPIDLGQDGLVITVNPDWLGVIPEIPLE